MYSQLSSSCSSIADEENIDFNNVLLQMEYQRNNEKTVFVEYWCVGLSYCGDEKEDYAIYESTENVIPSTRKLTLINNGSYNFGNYDIPNNKHADAESSTFTIKNKSGPNYSCRVKLDRPIFEHNVLTETFNKTDLNSDGLFEIKTDVNFSRVARNCLYATIPSLVWLGSYKWKDDLVNDVVAGCTVAVMNIPQGMAYALLGNVPPVVGIYMAIFPVIAYALLGTSKHVSMGSFAVICLMTGNVVNTYSSASTSSETSSSFSNETTYSPLEVATAVTCMVGIYQVGMYVFQLGAMCSLLSETLVNGLTAGAAIHVLTSQLKDLFGMEVVKFTGNFQLVYTYGNIMGNLNKVNIATCVLSLITITVLLMNNYLIKPWVSKRSLIPVPIELIAILLGTYASSFWGIAEKYDLTTVGDIAIGLPDLKLPTLSIIPAVAWDSFVIAVIAYVISMSMALIFSHKLNYEIDANQELLAQGAGNLLGSCFSCLPFSASLSRSVIQQAVGGRTQLSSIISVSILVVVITWFAQIFETLPRCILASLIVVALKGVLWQVKDIIEIWRLSSIDGIVWLITYLTVILVDIDVGLLVGVIASNLTIFSRAIRPDVYQLARLPNTELYVDSRRFNMVESIEGICIVHYSGALNFANQRYFKQKVLEIVKNRSKQEFDKIHLSKATSKTVMNSEFEEINWMGHNVNFFWLGQIKGTEMVKSLEHRTLTIPDMLLFKMARLIDCFVKEVEYLILDLSAVHYTDPSGAMTIMSIVNKFSQEFIRTLLVVKTGAVYDALRKCGVLNEHKVVCFPTVHDAVVFAENNKPHSIQSIGI